MTQNHNLRRVARSTIVLALLDYAKAHKTLKSPATSKAAAVRNHKTQQEITEFFEDTENPLFEFAEMDPIKMLRDFRRLAANSAGLDAVAKLKYVG